MNKLLTYLGFSSLWAALCAYSLVLLTIIVGQGYHISYFHPLLLFVFGSTLLVYNAHNYFKVRKRISTQRNTWNLSNTFNIICWGAVGFILTSVFVFHLHRNGIALLIILTVLTLSYSYPLLRFNRSRVALKSMGILKPFLLSLVWVAVTFLLPIVELAIPLSPELVLRGAIRWIFILILCILFDIKDIQVDREKGIRTFPVLLGTRLLALLHRVINGVILLLAAAFFYFDRHLFYIVQILAFLLLKIMLRRIRPNKSELFYVINVDGMMLLYSILLIICTVLTTWLH